MQTDDDFLEEIRSKLVKQERGLKIKKGDKIRIVDKWGTFRYSGTVLTANNYPQGLDANGVYIPNPDDRPDDWYIEFTHDWNGSYAYWKQDPDGGIVQLVE